MSEAWWGRESGKFELYKWWRQLCTGWTYFQWSKSLKTRFLPCLKQKKDTLWRSLGPCAPVSLALQIRSTCLTASHIQTHGNAQNQFWTQMGSRAEEVWLPTCGGLTYCSGLSVAANPVKIHQRGKGKSDGSKLSTRQLLVVPVVPDDMRLKMAFSGGFIFLILWGLQLKATTFNVNIEARESIL